ncbi:MAG: phage portal protein [Planctomycetaceae bacterium]|jgi:lambda family phage portal protein|nr:phage portal protein [Planctomycetaceae bacterium]
MFNIFGKIKSTATTVKKMVLGSSPHKLTFKEERAYWGDANGLSADSMITPEFRRKWRNIARYEINCNSYANGLMLTLADVGIGTGARLQLLTEDKNYNSQVEQEFTAWAETINLGEKLKTLRKAKCVDGEAFAIIVNNPKVRHAVNIDLRIVECDRVTTPYPVFRQRVDGIDYDKYGNPVSYDVLKEHPGGLLHSLFNEVERVPAEFMLHWYRQNRPEQSRGVTELLPSLPLFAQLRRYTEAVLKAAEVAADIIGVIKNSEGDIAEVKNTVHEIERGMFNVIPSGWDFSQLKAEQPTTTYQMFKREILSEIGRCLQIPTNIILGDSSNYNYASGRLDHQTFYKSIKNEQEHCEKVVLFPLLEMWYREAVRVGLIAERPIPQISSQYACFYWDAMEHVDPLKEAKAAATRRDSGFTTDSYECGRLGMDYEDVYRQRAREMRLKEELGLTEPIKNNNNNNTENEESDGENE